MKGRRETDIDSALAEALFPAPTFQGHHAMSVVLGALLVIIAVLGYFHFKPEPAPTGVHIIATPAPEVVKVGTEFIDFEPIKVFKAEAKKKLNMPTHVQADANQHVVASTRTANDERSHTVTTLLDARTREFTTYDRVEPRPWLAVNTKSEVGAFIGLKDGEQTLRVEGKQEFLQIKAVHLGVTVSADVNREGVDTFVGVGGWARW